MYLFQQTYPESIIKGPFIPSFIQLCNNYSKGNQNLYQFPSVTKLVTHTHLHSSEGQTYKISLTKLNSWYWQGCLLLEALRIGSFPFVTSRGCQRSLACSCIIATSWFCSHSSSFCPFHSKQAEFLLVLHSQRRDSLPSYVMGIHSVRQ